MTRTRADGTGLTFRVRYDPACPTHLTDYLTFSPDVSNIENHLTVEGLTFLNEREADRTQDVLLGAGMLVIGGLSLRKVIRAGRETTPASSVPALAGTP